MKRITEDNIEQIVSQGENQYIEFKTYPNPMLYKVILAFANTEGGTIIFGLKEVGRIEGKRNFGEEKAEGRIEVEWDPNREKDVYRVIKDYSNLCEVYYVKYRNVEIPVIDVEKSEKIIPLEGKIYYRQGDTNRCIDAEKSKEAFDVVYNSVKNLTLSEIAEQTKNSKENVKRILESKLWDKPIYSKLIGNDLFYSKREDTLKPTEEKISLDSVKNYLDLISYLKYKGKALVGNNLLHQYTTVGAALEIIKSGEFYMGSPSRMNDVAEYENFVKGHSKNKWEEVFFTCFMDGDNESIAMWSQYAQPWESGIRFSMPVEKVKEWRSSIKKVYEAEPGNKKKTGKHKDNNAFDKNFYAVAYTNEDDIKKTGGMEKVAVGQAEKLGLTALYKEDDLCGYVKNIAWSYEKEYRLRVDIPGNGSEEKFAGIIVPIPDDVLKSIIIMKGPRLDESDPQWKELLTVLKNKGMDDPKSSIFDGKLQNMVCDRCQKIKK